MRKPRLIDDWRRPWRLASVWVFALVSAFPDLYSALAAFDMLDALPSPAVWGMRVLGLAGIVARLLRQKRKTTREDER